MTLNGTAADSAKFCEYRAYCHYETRLFQRFGSDYQDRLYMTLTDIHDARWEFRAFLAALPLDGSSPYSAIFR